MVRSPLIAVFVCVVQTVALAAPEAEADGGTLAPDGPSETSAEERIHRLEEENARLAERLAQLEEEVAFTEHRVDEVLPLTAKVSGYLDVGAFYVTGDGSGLITDLDHKHFPQYSNITDSWVFMGDPLSTAINSRGDPATTGESRAVTFDPIRSQGVPSFIVNNVNLALFAGIGENATVNASVDFLPRTRIVADSKGLFLGDFFDVKLAYAEYRVPLTAMKLSLFAGKFDSVLGVEYRTQESPTRLTITPSLICRYTCGRPIGVKARAELLDDRLSANLAVTNGSSVIESFGFNTETDTNWFKTVSGRLAWKFPIGAGVELGASGAFGAQDAQTQEDVFQWHLGADVRADWQDLVFSAEFVRGHADGVTRHDEAACGAAPCIDYRGAYGQLGYRMLNWFEPYARVDWRHARHLNGDSFAYISDLMRVTAGARFEIDPAVVVKAECVLDQELGGIPSFPNDVFTTSLVVRY